MTKAVRENLVRDEILEVISKALEEHFDCDLFSVGCGKVAVPTIDAERNDIWGLVQVSIPRGTRTENGYEPYDGEAAAREYAYTLEDREAKKTAREEKAKLAEIEKEKKRAEKKAQAEAKKAILELKKIKIAKSKETA